MTTPELVDLPLELIDLGENVRTAIDDDADEELSTSLDEVGLLQPVRVRREGSRYRLVIGSRRFAAATLAGSPTIPAIVDARPPDAIRDSIEQLNENIQRKDLNPMDVATALQRILAADPSISAAVLARRLGKNKGWAYRHLALLRLPSEVQGDLRAGRLNVAHVVPLNGHPPDEQVRLGRLAAQGASSKAIEQASWEGAHRYSVTIGEVKLNVKPCPDDSRYVRVMVDAPEPITTLDLDSRQARRLAKVLSSIAAFVEIEHPVPRERERLRPTRYPATRRPAKRPRRAKDTAA